MGTINTWISSMKVVMISVGVLSFAMALKFSIPIAVNGAPALWSTIVSCMKPPYLYIIINGIIITIAASSRFHHSNAEPEAVRHDHLISVKTPPAVHFDSISAPAIVIAAVSEVGDRIADLKPVTLNGSKEVDDLIRAEAEDVFDESSLPDNPLLHQTISSEVQIESLFPVREKPLVSSRFVHRKPNRITPEVGGARVLRRVARPKRHETLESTWKMITEGRHVPLTRHLKKSDTSEHPSVVHVEGSSCEPRIRKEPSLSQDELNRKVEAFIHKFNEEMRMQRQESLNQYMEMINRGL